LSWIAEYPPDEADRAETGPMSGWRTFLSFDTVTKATFAPAASAAPFANAALTGEKIRSRPFVLIQWCGIEFDGKRESRSIKIKAPAICIRT
jgi:hypothetical protein